MLADWICDHDLDCKDGTDEKVAQSLSEKHSRLLIVTVTHASSQKTWENARTEKSPTIPAQKATHNYIKVSKVLRSSC